MTEPLLMVETPHLFWFTVGSLTLANLCLLVFGLTGIRIFTKLVECPRGILIPLILVLSAVNQRSNLSLSFSESDISDDFMPVQGFLEKPVEPRVLLEKINEVLRGAASDHPA